jgi:hypothetical protein
MTSGQYDRFSLYIQHGDMGIKQFFYNVWEMQSTCYCGEPQIDRGFAGKIARRGARRRRLERRKKD